LPVYDTTTILGGFGQQLVNVWAWGDDHQFSGDVQLSPEPPPPGDLSLTDAYFTMKAAPTQPDADSLIQIHITQTLSASGQITAGEGGYFSQLLIKVPSGDLEGTTGIYAGPVYNFDIRVITAGGVTFTVAQGTIIFLQNDTQTNYSGTPAAIPNQGQPVFRGFIYDNPQNIMGLITTYNAGDWYMNSNPINGNGSGWQCTIGGQPGTWITLFGSGPSPGNPFFKGYTNVEPSSIVGYVVADYYLNSSPASASPEGWILTAAGWRTFGIVGDT
jgi:hypothetical protein